MADTGRGGSESESEARFARACAIFESVADLPERERRRRLDAACGDDAPLRREVAALIEADVAATGFLDAPARDRAAAIFGDADDVAAPLRVGPSGDEERGDGGAPNRATALDRGSAGIDDASGAGRGHASGLGPGAGPGAASDSDPDALPGTRLGPWRIDRRIGSGGMGVVYQGRRADGRYDKQVAIKVVRLDPRAGGLMGRFRHERDVLATLDHPSLVRIVDAGELDDGRPYLVMDLVVGPTTIDRWCATHRLDVRRRLELFLVVCDAVAAAHHALIVHRDLKPGNILVDIAGDVRLVDFGIASLVRDDDETGGDAGGDVGSGAGRDGAGDAARDAAEVDAQRAPVPARTIERGVRFTPGYASPEQRRGAPSSVTMDVYALGVVLHQLLTGVTPDPDEGTRITPPSTAVRGEGLPGDPVRWARTLTGDLDAIVLMATDPDTARRYRRVEALADDVRRYLEFRPVHARRNGPLRVAHRFVRRHTIGTTLGAIALGSVLAGSAAIAVSAQRAAEAADVARAERDAARTARELSDAVRTFLTDMLEAPRGEVAGYDVRVMDLLDPARAEIATRFPDRPEVRVELLNVLGGTYLSLDRVAEAESCFREAIAQSDAFLDELDTGSIAARNGLGKLLVQQRRTDEAEPLILETIARKERVHGPESETVLVERNNYGNLLRGAGRQQEARAVLADVLDTRRRLYGDDDPRLLISYHNLGSLCVELGDLDSAIEYGQRALDGCTEHFGPGDPRTLIVMNSMVEVLTDSGRWADAEALARALIERQTEHLAPGHSDLAYARHQLASCLYEQGRYAEAATELRLAIDRARAEAGPPLDVIWAATITLVDCLIEQDQSDEGLRLADDLAQLGRTHLTPARYRIHAIDLARGRALAGLGRSEEAQQVVAAARADTVARHGADHPSVALADRLLVRWGSGREEGREELPPGDARD